MRTAIAPASATGLWAVADGMGGHEGGEWASAKLVEKLDADRRCRTSFEAACDAVAEAIRDANRGDRRRGARSAARQMGSTVVALLVRGQRYAVLWVGDSRAYLLRGGKLVQLSRDHTQVQEMVDRGMMRPEDAVGHPMGHILSRAVGVREEIEVDRALGEIEPGDVFLLCSDGLHGYVDEAEIARLLARGSPERALDAADRADARERRARQCHRDRGLGQRPDPAFLRGAGAIMNDDKDKTPPEEERTVFAPGGGTGGRPPAEEPAPPSAAGR